jgi:tetratricopeptide (TPR) repeat protein
LLEDDYGVVSAALRIVPVGEVEAEDVVVEPLELLLDSPPGARSVEEVARFDLTQHPWAGREVELRLLARDAIGQVGESAPVVMKLPERIFVDPLARAILEQRTTLFADAAPYAPMPDAAPLTAEDAANQPTVQTDQVEERLGRAPESVARARRSLELMMRGAAMFEDDSAVHLGLAYAAERLARARERAEFSNLRDVLWDAALRAEGGDLADAERALREAERALARALARGDSPEEIARLLEEYREAVNRYMEALTLEALREGRVLTEFSGGQPGGGAMGEDQLQAMLQALQDLAETGSNDDARRALAALSEMLRNMEVQLAMGAAGGGGQSPPSSPMSEALRDALQELADVLGRQRETMDQTQLADQGQDGQQGPNAPSGQNGQGGQNQPGQTPGATPGQGQGGSPRGSGEQGEEGLADGQGSRPNGERSGQGGPGEGDPEFGPGFGQLLDQQRAIREALNELMEGLDTGDVTGGSNGGGATDEALDRAGEEMRRAGRSMELAEDALGDQDGAGALLRQGQALDALREGLEALAEGAQSAERAARGIEDDNTERADRDPFGRSAAGSGFDVGNSVRVPDEMERRKAREILDELRRRMGEASRPEDELDYLRRLLERF